MQAGSSRRLTLDTNLVMEIDFQKIITSSDGGLNRIAFNTEEPVLVVGDTAGTIHSLKLSPNLRKKTKEIIRAAQNGSQREVRFSHFYMTWKLWWSF